MNRIEQCIAQARTDNKPLLVPYITAGDPTLDATVPLMHALVKGGANLLELGVPFSDPFAEGVVIQAAMERALKHQTTLEKVLEMVALFRETDTTTPVVLMGYLNVVEQYGYALFAQRAASVGVDGTLWVDLPPEESDKILPLWQQHDLYPIFLCSPTTTAARMALMSASGKGYLYYVSLKGVTGAVHTDLAVVEQAYLEKKSQTTWPVLLGFGIKTPEMVQAVSRFADGVVIGAALIEHIFAAYGANQDINQVATDFMADMQAAITKRNITSDNL